MKRQDQLLLLSDVFLSFLIISFSPGADACQKAMLSFSCLLFAVCLAARRCHSILPRFLLALLPGCGLLLAPIDNLFVLLALVWAYSLLVVSAGEYNNRLRVLRMYLVWFFIVWVLLLMLNEIYYGGIFSVSDFSSGSTNSVMDMGIYETASPLLGADHLLSLYSSRLLLYLFFYFFIGVYTRRLYLMHAAMPRSWHWYNALSIGALSVGALVVSALAVLLLRLLRPLGSWLFSGIAKLLMLLFGSGTQQAEEDPLVSHQPVMDLSDYIHGPRTETDWDTDLASSARPAILGETVWRYVFAVLLLCLLLALLFLLLRRIRRHRTRPEEPALIYEDTEPLGEEGAKRRTRSRLGSGERQSLRRIYRRYLVFLRKRGLSIQKSSTSQDILTDSRTLGGDEAAVRLRRLYLKARYAILTPVSREDVQEAARCLKQIVNEASHTNTR